MNPKHLAEYLGTILEHDIRHAIMIWGKPGIGKSSIVRTLAEQQGKSFVDVRLSQLMPSDLRGIPVPLKLITHWAPPAFLPTEGSGILFLDEINMAPPAMQGVAQQLILDHRVGDYVLPEGWFVWAAGNRADDRAAVYEMPSPLTNRFLHLDVEVDLDDFKQYAYRTSIHPAVIGFLSFRPDLLHNFHPEQSSWPSPRTWEMASNLLHAGLPISSAVGDAIQLEFDAYVEFSDRLPDAKTILDGTADYTFPSNASLCYALCVSLVSNVSTPEQGRVGFMWMIDNAPAEWVQLFVADLFPQLREKSIFDKFCMSVVKEPEAMKFLNEFTRLAA